MNLLSVLQIRWPPIVCLNGTVELVFNRPGNNAMDVGAANTLYFAPGPAILTKLDLSQKQQINTGQSALDDVLITFMDSPSYVGTINGTPITEDFSNAARNLSGIANSTVLSQVFNIKGTQYKPNPYRVRMIWRDELGNADIQVFTYDAIQKLQPKQKLFNPETNIENVKGNRTVQLVSILNASSSVLWRDVLTRIDIGDCAQGDFYNGFVVANNNYAGTTSWLLNSGIDASDGQTAQAVPYIEVQPEQNGTIMRSANAYGFDGRENEPYSATHPQIDSVKPWPSQRGYTNWKVHPLIDTILNIGSGGTGYSVGDSFQILGGSPNATGIIDSVSSGVVTSFHLTDGGEGYVNTHGNMQTTSNVGHGFAVNFISVDGGVSILPESWGPWGTWGISLNTLISKCCDAMGYASFAGVQSAFDLHKQDAFSTDGGNIGCFSIGDPIDPSGWWVSLNLIAGAHPWDGSQWLNPCAMKPDQPIADLLRQIYDFLCVDDSVVTNISGDPVLHLTPFGNGSGTRPSGWIVGPDSTEESPAISTNMVSINYRGDSVKIICPLLSQQMQSRGTPLAKEVAFRLRRFGLTYPSPIGFVLDKRALTWDDNTNPFNGDTSTKFFKIATLPTGDKNVQVNQECWLSLTGIYLYTTDSTLMHQTYPSSVWNRGFDDTNVTSSPNGDGYGSGDYSKGAFLALGCQYPAGTTKNLNEPNFNRFDGRWHQSVAFATYKVPQPTVIKRSYLGVTGDDGKLTSVKVGFSNTFLYDDEIRTFEAIEINRRLRPGVSSVRYQEIIGGVFPEIDAIPAGQQGSTGGSMSSSSTYTGVGGGGSTGNISGSGWIIITPVTLTTNTDNWIMGVPNSSCIAFISSTIDIGITGIVGGASGLFLRLINIGSHFITLVSQSGSSAANQFLFGGEGANPIIGLAPNGSLELLYDSTTSKWRVLSTQ